MPAPTTRPLPSPQRCPPWCTGCAMTNGHFGDSAEMKLSMDPIPDHGAFLAVGLAGFAGEVPYMVLSDGDAIADLTIEEAEQFAGILLSLAAQARGEVTPAG